MTIKYRPQALRPGQKSHWYCDICQEEVMPEDKGTHRCRKGPVVMKLILTPEERKSKRPQIHNFVPKPSPLIQEPPRCPKCGGAGRKAGSRSLAGGSRNPRFECTSCMYKYSRPAEKLRGNKKWNAELHRITDECKKNNMSYSQISDVIYERTGVRINRSNIRRGYLKAENGANARPLTT